MRRFVVLAAVFALVALGPTVEGRAAPVPLPENGTVVFQGHGWGHGRGMGQWGAKGMADQGASWQNIVTHYYAGTTIGSRAPETIRVLVETSPDTVVTSDAPFKIAWTTGTLIATSDATFKYWRVTLSGSSYLVQKSASSTGPWTAVRSSSQAVVFTPGTQMLQLIFDNGVVRYYHGTITSRYASGAGMRAIDELSLEQYLYGSVPRESPSSWPAEELKAQAVAARSYAVYKKLNARAAGQSYDICTTTACQSYLGYASKPSVNGTKTVLEAASSNAAVDATAGKVLLYNGSPICAEYSSSTGGYTSPGSVAYEKAVPDPTDSVGPLHDWTGDVAVSAIEARWPSIGRLVDLTVTQRNGFGDWGGRVLQMNVVGTTGTTTISGWDMQGAFSSAIRSNWFTPLYWRGEIVSAPASITVNQGAPLTVPVSIKNTGAASWAIGGPVRISTPATSLFYLPSWISTTRVVSTGGNVTAASASNVAPGQTAQFRLPLSTNMQPGDYSQRFSLVADGLSVTSTTFTIMVHVLKPWVAEAGDDLTNGSFETAGGWSGSGRTSGDTVTTTFARDGTHAFALTAGTKNIYQTIAFGGGRARTFTLGGWNRSDGTVTSGGPITISATARYTDGTTQAWSLGFGKSPHAWAYNETTLTTSATKDLASITVYGQISAQLGTTYFDALRLVEGAFVNPSFERGLINWTTSGFVSGDGATVVDKRDGAQSLQIAGAGGSKSARQTVTLNAPKGEQLMLSVWNVASGTVTSGGPIEAVLSLHHPDGSTSSSTLSFAKGSHSWTLGQLGVVTSAPVDSATISLEVSAQTGTVGFDDVRLFRDAGANSSFEGSLSPWSTYGFSSGDGLVTTTVRDGAGALALKSGGVKGVRGYVSRSGSSGVRYIVSGWSKTAGTSATGGSIALMVEFINHDGTTTYRSLAIPKTSHDWTYVEASVASAKQFDRIIVFAISYDQTGTTWFDGIRLRIA